KTQPSGEVAALREHITTPDRSYDCAGDDRPDPWYTHQALTAGILARQNLDSLRQSPAKSSMTRSIRGERASQGLARMRGSSARRKRKPCRTATPRSNRKARI